MKPLASLLFSACMLAGVGAIAQCPLSFNFTVSNNCNGLNDNGAFVNGALNCPNSTSYVLEWNYSNGATGSQNLTGMQFQQWIPIPAGVTEICVSLTSYNSQLEVTGYNQQCEPVFLNPPLIVQAIVTQNSTCGMSDACVTLYATGGLPPYTYFFNTSNFPGSGMTGEMTTCGLPPGTYYGMVSDANGCTQGAPFTITDESPIGLVGKVFNDLNGDGTQGTGQFAELGIGNQPVYIVEAELTVFTDENGFFSAPDLPAGTYTLQWQGDTEFWTGQEVTADAPGCTIIPLESTTPIYDQNSGLAGWGSLLHCQNGLNTGVWVANTGNVPLNGTLSLTTPVYITVSAASNGDDFDSASSGSVEWLIDGQAAGTNVSYNVHLNGPGTSMLGQSVPLVFHLVLTDTEGNVIHDQSWTINPVISCSYDPNDKAAYPEGYAEPHYILAGTDITYRIRFQNTGNAPAERVEIVDQLDVNLLNIGSFEPIEASHSYEVSISNAGEVRYVFEDINLPDSLSDPEGSEGYVLFHVRANDMLYPLQVIENDAEIYFDLNPPIVTNTVYHTIFHCGLIPLPEDVSAYCEGDVAQPSSTAEYIESYVWKLNDELISDTSSAEFVAEPSGNHTLTLEMTNPLCNVTGTQTVIVHPNPATTLEYSNGLLTASPQGDTEWYLDGELIDGISSSTYEPVNDGVYTVQVTNEFDCSATSPEVMVVGIKESVVHPISLFPNPLHDTGTLTCPAGTRSANLTDASGRVLRSWNNPPRTLIVTRDGLAPGIYFLKALGAFGQSTLTMAVE